MLRAYFPFRDHSQLTSYEQPIMWFLYTEPVSNCLELNYIFLILYKFIDPALLSPTF